MAHPDYTLAEWKRLWKEVKAGDGVRTRGTPGWFWSAYVRLRLDLAKDADEAADAISKQATLEKPAAEVYVGYGGAIHVYHDQPLSTEDILAVQAKLKSLGLPQVGLDDGPASKATSAGRYVGMVSRADS